MYSFNQSAPRGNKSTAQAQAGLIAYTEQQVSTGQDLGQMMSRLTGVGKGSIRAELGVGSDGRQLNDMVQALLDSMSLNGDNGNLAITANSLPAVYGLIFESLVVEGAELMEMFPSMDPMTLRSSELNHLITFIARVNSVLLAVGASPVLGKVEYHSDARTVLIAAGNALSAAVDEWSKMALGSLMTYILGATAAETNSLIASYGDKMNGTVDQLTTMVQDITSGPIFVKMAAGYDANSKLAFIKLGILQGLSVLSALLTQPSIPPCGYTTQLTPTRYSSEPTLPVVVANTGIVVYTAAAVSEEMGDPPGYSIETFETCAAGTKISFNNPTNVGINDVSTGVITGYTFTTNTGVTLCGPTDLIANTVAMNDVNVTVLESNAEVIGTMLVFPGVRCPAAQINTVASVTVDLNVLVKNCQVASYIGAGATTAMAVICIGTSGTNTYTMQTAPVKLSGMTVAGGSAFTGQLTASVFTSATTGMTPISVFVAVSSANNILTPVVTGHATANLIPNQSGMPFYLAPNGSGLGFTNIPVNLAKAVAAAGGTVPATSFATVYGVIRGLPQNWEFFVSAILQTLFDVTINPVVYDICAFLNQLSQPVQNKLLLVVSTLRSTLVGNTTLIDSVLGSVGSVLPQMAW